uniref:Uncharacterized protein n=1 Tax=Salmonella dublin TaxID=98360 RepID=F5BQR9_SALDU|nr:hypothetical protein pSD853_7.9_6 [Salmonella enterica subsp. enterica serovar Dublin]
MNKIPYEIELLIAGIFAVFIVCEIQIYQCLNSILIGKTVLKIEKVAACFRSILSLIENLTQRTICSCVKCCESSKGFSDFLPISHRRKSRVGGQPTSGTNFRCDSENERATSTAGRTSKFAMSIIWCSTLHQR